MGFFKEKQRVIPRTVAYGERMGALRPLLLKILFFLTQSRKKLPFQGYLVTRTIWKKTLRFPLPFKKKLIANDLRPPALDP